MSAVTPVTKDDSKRADCPGCGATLIFSAKLQKLTCDYCGAEVDIKQGGELPKIMEKALETLLAARRSGEEEGLGTSESVIHCQQCGASVNFGDKKLSGECCFCGSNLVVERKRQEGLIRPEGLLPFKVPKDQANESFKKWVASLWFRPNDLKRRAAVEEIDGVYIPFWTFDATADTRWHADSGYYYYESETYTDSEGKRQTRQVQKVRWEPSSGTHLGTYDDLLICASRGLPSELVVALEPFPTVEELVPYQASFLSGWGAEEYGVEPKEAWELGKQRFEREEYSACARLVPGDTHRNLRISMKLSEVTWKHCLLPIYVAAYQYKGKSYRFLINGNTGLVSGDAPYSFWKIFFTVLVVIAIVAFLMSNR